MNTAKEAYKQSTGKEAVDEGYIPTVEYVEWLELAYGKANAMANALVRFNRVS